MAFSAFDEIIPFLNQAVIHDTDGTSAIGLISGQVRPARIDTFAALSIDTVDREFVVQIQNAGGAYQVCFHFTVPALAGTAGHATFDVLGAILPAQNQGLVLPLAQGLQLNAVVALSAAKYAAFTIIGGNV